jgi:hypothetical protein
MNTLLQRLKRLVDPNRLLDALDSFEAWNARQSPFLRVPLGLTLCLGGGLFILPVFGLWMLPLGLLILSEDIPWLRNRRERVERWLRRLIGERRQRRLAQLEDRSEG